MGRKKKHTTTKYICKPCKYETFVKCNYQKHLNTKKHLSITKNDKNEIKIERIEDDKWKCPKCAFIFKHSSSFYRHSKKNCCETIINETINNNTTNNNTTNIKTQNNIETQNINNNISITFNINSKEEAEFIKSILTPEKIMEICKPIRMGLPMQSYDIVKNIQKLSLESKKNNLELLNFQKTNVRDNIIDVLENNVFKKIFFRKYNLEDLHKFATAIMDKVANDDTIEPDKTYDEKMDLICDILKDYEYYKTLPDEDRDGTADFILNALEECEKESKIEHYNMTMAKIKRLEKIQEEEDKRLIEAGELPGKID